MTLTDRLPIEGYDALRVSDILPRLSGLSLVQLGAIFRHELSHKARSTVLERVEVLLREAARASVPLPRRPVDDLDDPFDGDSDYGTHDPRLWRRCLIDVRADEPTLFGRRRKRRARHVG